MLSQQVPQRFFKYYTRYVKIVPTPMNNRQCQYIFLFIFLSMFAITSCEARSVDKVAGDTSILFQDDFSNPDSSWDNYQDDYGETRYKGGAYRILVNEPETDLWANPDGLVFNDTHIEVEARRAGGSSNNIFGILCRYQGPKDFYQLLVSSDGYYDISKVKDDVRYPLTGEQLLPSEVIPQDSNTLKLAADCIGNTLTLYVDGSQVASTQDSDFSTGNIGLIAGAYEEPGTDISFDNLVVRQP